MSACKYDKEAFLNPWEWFDDEGADDGKDPWIPTDEGVSYGISVRGPRSWTHVKAGTQAHTCAETEFDFSTAKKVSMADDCAMYRNSYWVGMVTKLDSANGFTVDQPLAATRAVLVKWQEALANLGGPVAP